MLYEVITQLTELSAIDWIAERGGFEVFYQMLSMTKRKRIRVKCFIKENEAINSIEKLFRSADWSEREMYDMFGIKINNHPYMKRILMPDDWEGYPLRKTYPLRITSYNVCYTKLLRTGSNLTDGFCNPFCRRLQNPGKLTP